MAKKVLNYNDVLKELKARRFSPIYFLQGDEFYFIDIIAKFIEEELLPEAERSFNMTVLYGRDSNMTSILNQARRFPMMSEFQIVLVKEAQYLADLSKQGGQEALMAYLQNPVPTTLLVFSYVGKKLDGRQALAKKIDKNGVLFTSAKIYENQVPDWINNFLAENSIKITPKANAILTEYLGNNLERISNELRKIILNLSGENTINENHIEKYVGINKDFNFFELQKCISFRDYEKIFRILNYFERNEKNNPPVVTIAMFYRFFTKVLPLYKITQPNENNIAEAMGRINRFQAREYLAARNNYSLQQVIRGIELLAEADLRLKGVNSGSMNSAQVVNEFVTRFLQ